MSQTLRSRLSGTSREQHDKDYLRDYQLPEVPKSPSSPKIVNNMKGKETRVITNDDHSKQSLNGYKRKPDGCFFNH